MSQDLHHEAFVAGEEGLAQIPDAATRALLPSQIQSQIGGSGLKFRCQDEAKILARF